MIRMCFPSHPYSDFSGYVSARLADYREGEIVVDERASKAFRAAWPLAGIGFAVAINGVWIGILGYGISKLF
jgi:hypothetical protein